jgi:hypothetical protein
MDLDALLGKPGPLTDDELAFIEQNLLLLSRALVGEISEITGKIQDEEPELARKLEGSAASVLLNVENAINVGRPETEH